MRRLERRRGGKRRSGCRRARLGTGLRRTRPEPASTLAGGVRVQIHCVAVWREGEHGCNGGEGGEAGSPSRAGERRAILVRSRRAVSMKKAPRRVPGGAVRDCSAALLGTSSHARNPATDNNNSAEGSAKEEDAVWHGQFSIRWAGRTSRVGRGRSPGVTPKIPRSTHRAVEFSACSHPPLPHLPFELAHGLFLPVHDSQPITHNQAPTIQMAHTISMT